MLPFFLSLSVAFFKTLSDSGTKVASKRLQDDRVLVFLQRFVESLVAGILLFLAYFIFDFTFGNYSSYFTSTFILLVLIDVTLGGAAIYFNTKAIRMGELSIVAPISQLTPAILLVTSPLLVGDLLTLGGVVGVCTVVLGSYILGIQDLQGIKSFYTPLQNIFNDKGVKYALLASFLYGITSNITKLAAQMSDPIFLVFFVGMITSCVFFALLLFRGTPLFTLKFSDAKFGVAPGITGALGSIIQVYVVTIWSVPYVIAIKRLSSVFSSLVGVVFFKEKNPIAKIIGSCVMVLGTILIVLLG